MFLAKGIFSWTIKMLFNWLGKVGCFHKRTHLSSRRTSRVEQPNDRPPSTIHFALSCETILNDRRSNFVITAIKFSLHSQLLKKLVPPSNKSSSVISFETNKSINVVSKNFTSTLKIRSKILCQVAKFF